MIQMIGMLDEPIKVTCTNCMTKEAVLQGFTAQNSNQPFNPQVLRDAVLELKKPRL